MYRGYHDYSQEELILWSLSYGIYPLEIILWSLYILWSLSYGTYPLEIILWSLSSETSLMGLPLIIVKWVVTS